MLPSCADLDPRRDSSAEADNALVGREDLLPAPAVEADGWRRQALLVDDVHTIGSVSGDGVRHGEKAAGHRIDECSTLHYWIT
jgi:hypothetical protein